MKLKKGGPWKWIEECDSQRSLYTTGVARSSRGRS